MSPRRRIAAAVVLAALAAAARAAADPTPPAPDPDLTKYVHFQSASTVTTDGGSTLRLPPGYFYDEPTHAAVEADYKTLQDAQTRLTAENTSMRASLANWQPGWYTLAGVFIGGIALGWYAHDKL